MEYQPISGELNRCWNPFGEQYAVVIASHEDLTRCAGVLVETHFAETNALLVQFVGWTLARLAGDATDQRAAGLDPLPSVRASASPRGRTAPSSLD